MNAHSKDIGDSAERPEGDMAVGSTSIALGGKKSLETATSRKPPSAPPDGAGSVGDGKQFAEKADTNSGTSSTSVGTGSGSSN